MCDFSSPDSTSPPWVSSLAYPLSSEWLVKARRWNDKHRATALKWEGHPHLNKQTYLLKSIGLLNFHLNLKKDYQLTKLSLYCIWRVGKGIKTHEEFPNKSEKTVLAEICFMVLKPSGIFSVRLREGNGMCAKIFKSQWKARFTNTLFVLCNYESLQINGYMCKGRNDYFWKQYCHFLKEALKWEKGKVACNSCKILW